MSVVAWFGLALGVANIVVWFAVVVAARRLWRQLGPTLAPLLAMFAPAETSGNTSNAFVVSLSDSSSGGNVDA